MTNLKSLLLALAAINLTACTANRPLTSAVRPNQITELKKFQTFSYISLVERGNRAAYNDSISAKSRTVFSNMLKTFERIPLSGDVQVTDSFVSRQIEKEIEYLCVNADNRKSIAGLKITPALDSLLEYHQQRFGLVTITTGFTRRKGNYQGQVAKGVGIGILTLGMAYPTPIKANSTVYAMIVDSKENNIAFFKKSVLQDKEPLDQIALRKQIRSIFEGYFWTKE
jgi:hypothetical protein